ncbi:MarR family winged helix-turn-helix transcriptional regulator [Agrococcus baldri]|uniref:Transcriptional regulator, MarR family protein n=1 Tax=Agrococcus baldri TaxID=153730 RepID=A0AA87UR07_9MICO|nr:MarR family transcriptional regulator [Agrococcus baldri]GEK79020.1 putative transcriptional regulator, MarR family protein [Agrococcus baldri]
MSARPEAFDPIAEARRQWLDHGWSDAAPGMTLVTSVNRAQQLLEARVESVLRPFALSFARFEVLRLLAFTREGRMPMQSAVRRLQVHPTSVTSTVDRLVRAGLVTREPHPTDGRATVLAITDAGRELVERATTALNRDAFAETGLEEAELTELVRIIALLRKRSGDFEDPRPAAEPL